MNKDSIVIVGRSLLSGGAERVIVQLANYFSYKGKKVYIITINDSKQFYSLDDSISLYKIGKKAENKILDKILRYYEVRKIIKCINPYAVLSLPEEIGIYVIFSMIGTGIPVFVSERNNPWVMPDVKITRLLRKAMYPLAKGIIFQTEMAKSFFPKYIQRKGIVIDNPVDVSRIPLLYEGSRNYTITAVGRLAPQKNFKLLINAFYRFSKMHDDYCLEIYGDGQLKNELEQQIKELGIAHKVSLCGAKKDVLDRIRCSSMFVLTSDYEGVPNVLLEAMCMGMPVISTDCPSGGPRKLIEDGINGLLTPVGDCDELVKRMDSLCDVAYASSLSKEAYKVREKFTNPDIFVQWERYIFN